MTTFADNVYTGLKALTSGLSSQTPVHLTRSFDFTGGGAQTKTVVVPAGSENFNAVCYIIQDGSAATTDSITVSAGGATLITFSSMGSAGGIVEVTTAAQGTKVVVASACATTLTAETTVAATLASTDTATVYRVCLTFNRARQISN